LKGAADVPLIKRFVVLWIGLGCPVAASGQTPAGDRVRTESEARGQAAEADRLFQQGEFAAAIPFYQAERRSRAALGDLRYEAYAWRAMGCCHDRLGQSEAAIDAWTAALALDAKREDRGFEGYDWVLIGDTERRRGRLEAAEPAFEKALPLLVTAADRDHETDARLFLSATLRDLGRPEDALPHLERALALAQALDDPRRQTHAVAQLGAVMLATDAPELAAEWLSDARDAYVGQGQASEAAALDRLLGDTFLALDRPDVAFARVEDAAAAHRALADAHRLADDLDFLATLKADTSDWAAARALARDAVAAWHGADDPAGEIEARVTLAHFESRGEDGDWKVAAATLNDAVALVLRVGAFADQVRILILAADVDFRSGNPTRGRSRLDQAATIAEQADNGALRAMVGQARERHPRSDLP
jgi:tetratricopeptide (TPR) repeat protein